MNVLMSSGMGFMCALSVRFISGCVLRCHIFNKKADTGALWTPCPVEDTPEAGLPPLAQPTDSLHFLFKVILLRHQ